MNEYRKKDVIKESDIDTFERMEVNRIKSHFVEKRKKPFYKRPFAVTLMTVFVLAFIIVASGGNGTDVVVDPINTESTGVFDATFKPISLKDLPRSLRGLDGNGLSNMSVNFNARPNDRMMFLSSDTSKPEFDLFDNEPDVVGEGQQTLTDIIEDKEMYQMAVEAFTNVGMFAPYLTSGVVSVTDEGDEYLYTINEDDTFSVILRAEKEDGVEVVEVKSYYVEEELFFEVTVQKIVDDLSDVYKIRYNRDNTEKYQYVRSELSGDLAEVYVSVVKDGPTTNVVAMHSVAGNNWKIVGNATDDYGVIFTEFTANEQNHMGVEYYNSEGALLKQEYGTQDLTTFNEAYEAIFEEFGKNTEVTIVNLVELFDDFSEPESFEVVMHINDAGVASMEEVDAILKVEDTEYDITYAYSHLLHSKKEDTFTSGDTIYFISDSEITDTEVIITYSAVYNVPNVEVGANGSGYYMFNRYMAKYIEPKEGFSINQKANGQYQIVNDAKVGEIGDKLDIEIKEIEEFFVDGEIVPVAVFNYTCDVQIKNINFTEIAVIEAAKTNLSELYSVLVPTTEELKENYNSIDITIFE